MYSNSFSIKTENLSKIYHIYNQPQDRLKQSIIPRLQKLVGINPTTYYREFWALRGVSFDIKKGETVGIIGRNGSGKSTLLQLIAGTLSPTMGSVETKGRITALLELGSGFNPEFTGRENIYLNAAILGVGNDEVSARFNEIASFADIGDFIDQPVKTYSSGMVVRLAFSVQAMLDPEILIVDEALAVGDEKFQRKCFARLDELKQNGSSILFVSHSTVQIIELCDRALLMENGERIMYGHPREVVKAYQKLIYSPEAQRLSLITKYRNYDSDLDLHHGENNRAEIGIDEECEQPNSEKLLKPADNNTELSTDKFDPGLVPDSTTTYFPQGAEINTMRIMDTHERLVNILSFGDEYIFEISGKFLSTCKNIYFGMHIKTISGIEFFGQRYPEQGQSILEIPAESNFRIRYHVKMCLYPGTYFAGSGIWSDTEPYSIHRVIDAVMFRVVSHQPLFITGYVDVSTCEPALTISH